MSSSTRNQDFNEAGMTASLYDEERSEPFLGGATLKTLGGMGCSPCPERASMVDQISNFLSPFDPLS